LLLLQEARGERYRAKECDTSSSSSSSSCCSSSDDDGRGGFTASDGDHDESANLADQDTSGDINTGNKDKKGNKRRFLVDNVGLQSETLRLGYRRSPHLKVRNNIDNK
jgi:hypothetical protein